MKIMHITKKYPNALGGDAIVVSNLQKQQIAAGHEVTIVTSNCDEIINEANVYKIGLKDTPARLDVITFRRLASLALLLFRMFKIVKEQQPNVIHTHSIDMAFCASFAARRYSIPIVHTFHIVTFYDTNQSIVRRVVEPWLARFAQLHRITAPNIYDVKKLQAAGLKQATLLPNGVDPAAWEIQNRTQDKPQFTFVAFGRLETQKGYVYLIRAAAKLMQIQPEAFSVVIVGDGSQKASLHRLINKLNVATTVSLVGRKDQEQIRSLLAKADVAIFPSLYETTPLSLLEAWSARVPVIATSVGILRDTPEDFKAACIVPPKNEQKLMLAMHRCMRDKELCALTAAKGYEEVRQYTWPTIAKTAETIYRRLCES